MKCIPKRSLSLSLFPVHSFIQLLECRLKQVLTDDPMKKI